MSLLSDIKQPKQSAYYQKMILLNLKFEFKTNNRIFFPNGKHQDLNDHTYKFEITLQSPVDTNGLAIDFYKIEADYRHHIAPILNVPILNNSLPEMNTTVENIAYYIWQQFDAIIETPASIHSLTLYETKQHSVTLTEEMIK
ncbi:6-pyruvoyl trahydropterin synthase family protein [Macrococcus animalis]|uniref:6-pyruvoyl trahydropterin synthase family protein n=1 Tax=Macrococcus animalis TaxID=3395467 RepID=UPI0039BDF41C